MYVPFSIHDIPGPCVGIFDNDAWSTGAHNWDYSSVVSVLIVSAELYGLNKLHLYLVFLECKLSQSPEAIFHYHSGDLRRPFFITPGCFHGWFYPQ